MDMYLSVLRRDATFVAEPEPGSELLARAGAPPALLLPLSLAGAPLAPDAAGATVLALLAPDLARLTLAYAALFFVALLLAPHALALCFGRGYARQTAATKAVAHSYCFATLHHALVCSAALPAIALDAREALVVPSRMAQVVPVSLAYLLVDLAVFCVPEALRDRSLGYIPHHLLGLGVTAAALLAPLRLMRFAAHFSACELSNFALAGLYACEKLGVSPAAPHHILLQATFLVSFTLTRVVNLPLVLAAMAFAHPREWAAAGAIGQLCSMGILALQFYWFGKILNKLLRNVDAAFRGKKTKAELAAEALVAAEAAPPAALAQAEQEAVVAPQSRGKSPARRR